jgi:hypothetical protein
MKARHKEVTEIKQIQTETDELNVESSASSENDNH